MARLALVLWLAGPAFAQTDRVVSVGVVGGLPLLEAFHTAAPQSLECTGTCSVYDVFPATKRYTAGAAVEFHVGARLGVEADVLYSRLNYSDASVYLQQSTNFQPVYNFAGTAASRWEIPLLVKYRLPGRIARPFLVAGPALSAVGTLHTAYDYGGFFHSTALSNPEQPDVFGFAFGGGLEWKIGPARISPQLRWAVWARPNIEITGYLRSNRNEGSVLLGLMF